MTAAPGTASPARGTSPWALTPAAIFAGCSLLLTLPPLTFFFFVTWPVHLILAILGIVFASVAVRGTKRGRKGLAITAIVVSALGILYILGWIGYWQFLSLVAGRPPGY